MFHFFCPDSCLWHLLLLRAKTAWILKGIRQTGWLKCQSRALAWQWVFKGTKSLLSNGSQLMQLDLSHRWKAELELVAVLPPCWHGIPHCRESLQGRVKWASLLLPFSSSRACFPYHISSLNLTLEFTWGTCLASFSLLSKERKEPRREKAGSAYCWAWCDFSTKVTPALFHPLPHRPQHYAIVFRDHFPSVILVVEGYAMRFALRMLQSSTLV